MKVRFRVLILVAFLSAASAHAARKPDQGQADLKLDPATGRGLLIVSLTMPNYSHGHLSNLEWWLAFRRLTKDKPAGKVPRSIKLEREDSWSGRTIHNDFLKPIYGVVYAVDLPAGEYALTQWGLNGNTTSLHMLSEGTRELPFEIQAGRATYVGNLNLKVRIAENVIGQEVPAGGGTAFTDQEERDIEIFLRKFPMISRDQIDADVTTDPSWQSLEEGEGGESDPVLPDD